MTRLRLQTQDFAAVVAQRTRELLWQQPERTVDQALADHMAVRGCGQRSLVLISTRF